MDHPPAPDQDIFWRGKHRLRTAAAKSLQSCPTLCDPRDGTPPGSPIPGILQARILEWVAISFSKTQNNEDDMLPFGKMK